MSNLTLPIPPLLGSGTLAALRHHQWSAKWYDWCKWRRTYEGGRLFVDTYLQKFSEREDTDDFNKRKLITYCPAFAKAAINEVKEAIFERMIDVTRQGGSESYQRAVAGNIDRKGSNMNMFMAQTVLPELLTMGKVGIFTDMPQISENASLRDVFGVAPYCYHYTAEQIMCWQRDRDNNLIAVLLKDCYDEYDPKTHLPTGATDQYRLLYLEGGTVTVQLFDDKGAEKGQPVVLKIPEIPLEILEISDSLLADVADYQIALLNIASSDLGYILKSNFPFYVEQVDSRSLSTHLKPVGSEGEADKEAEVKVGAVHGRQYTGTQAPQFINPSPEPLQASMEKQRQLKEEIRQLVHLAVSTIQSGKMASAESKGFDQRSLEAGLSYIGLVLEHAENQIAKFWSNYEGSADKAFIKYPLRYTLKSDEERAKESDACAKQMDQVPSLTYKKVMAKRIVEINIGSRVPTSTLETISKEIDAAKALVGDPAIVAEDVINGILGNETATAIRCYPTGEPERAAKDHADKLARVANSQMDPNVRGVTSTSDTTMMDRTGPDAKPKKLRGEGK